MTVLLLQWCCGSMRRGLLRDGAAAVAAFLCDGAAAADGANAELLRDGCSGVPL